MKKPSFSLLKKTLFALAAVLISIAAAFAYGYVNAKKSVRGNILFSLSVVSEGFEGKVYQFLEMAKRKAQDFASDGLVMDALEKGGGAGRGPLDAHLRMKRRLGARIVSIDVSDLRGVIIASTDEARTGRDVSGKPFLMRWQRAATAVQRTVADGKPVLSVSVPVMGRRGRAVGVLTNTIVLGELENMLTGEFEGALGAISSGTRWRTMNVYIADRQGRVIAGPRGYKGKTASTPPVAACVASGRETLATYMGLDGEEVAGSSRCLPALGWTLAVEVNRNELMAPIDRMRHYAEVMFAAIAGLSVLLAAVFYRGTISQLGRLSNAAGSMAGGDYGVRVPAGSNDEIGALGDAFNEMAAEIGKRTADVGKAWDLLNRAEHMARMGSWEWDIANDRMYWSEEMYCLFGLTEAEFGGSYEAYLGLVHPEDRDAVKKSVYDAFYGGRRFSVNHRIMRGDGMVRTVHAEADVSHDASGIPVKMAGLVQDVTEAKQAEFELKKLSMAIEGSINVVFITDADGNIEYVNPTFEQVTGYSSEEAIGQTPRILSSGDLSNKQYEDLWKAILSGKTWRGGYRNRKKDGGFYWCESVISPIRNESGEITHFLAVQEDLTEKRRSEERTKYLESHDELTGLANRAMFMETIDGWINGEGAGKSGVLLLADMDEFKFLNDAYGYGTGDEILRRVGKLIDEAAAMAYRLSRPDARPLVGRPGGDEFAIFLPDAGESDGLNVAETLREAVSGFHYAKDIPSSTISMGVVVYPEHGTSSRDLFTRADAAMYRAKEMGRNRSHLFKNEDRDLEKLHSRLSWKEKISKALLEGRFISYFQPILRLSDNRVLHYEALARMIDEDGKILLPGAFIDVAERFGLIGDIDRAIIGKAMSRISSVGGEISVSMNLSGKEIGDERLLDFIKAKMEETNVRPESLIFEITETAAIGDLGKAIEFTRSLKKLGCHLSLDDFGAGFTSFVYLKELKADYIKIDGSFIRKLHQSPADQIFVKAMSDCAHGLHIEVIAEFVENIETLSELRRIGVDYAQGYLIGKPAPSPEKMTEWQGAETALDVFQRKF